MVEVIPCSESSCATLLLVIILAFGLFASTIFSESIWKWSACSCVMRTISIPFTSFCAVVHAPGSVRIFLPASSIIKQQCPSFVISMVPGFGFEPKLADSESAVLPLDDPGVFIVLMKKRFKARKSRSSQARVIGIRSKDCKLLVITRLRAGTLPERVPHHIPNFRRRMGKCDSASRMRHKILLFRTRFHRMVQFGLGMGEYHRQYLRMHSFVY